MSELLKDLKAQYRSLDSSKEGCALRCEIVWELENHMPDQDVFGFLLRILLDSGDCDLVRISVLKLLPHQETSVIEKIEAQKVISDVLLKDDDCLVRQHAGIALSWFSEDDDALKILLRVVADESEDLDVRVNCLDGIESRGPCRRSIRVLQAICEENEIGGYATNVLNKW